MDGDIPTEADQGFVRSRGMKFPKDPNIMQGKIRRLLRTPEVAARVSRTLRKDRPDLGEADISASLTQFDDMWKALIPA